MLKPNAAKTARHEEIAALTEKFLAAGGQIVKKPVAVAEGLKKRKFLRKLKKVRTAA